MNILNSAIWWTGVGVLGAGAVLGAVGVFALLVVAAVAIGRYYAERLYNFQANVRLMVAWHEAGRPDMTPRLTVHLKDGVLSEDFHG